MEDAETRRVGLAEDDVGALRVKRCDLGTRGEEELGPGTVEARRAGHDQLSWPVGERSLDGAASQWQEQPTLVGDVVAGTRVRPVLGVGRSALNDGDRWVEAEQQGVVVVPVVG